MKVSKYLLIVEVTLMYLAHIPFYNVLFLIHFDSEFDNESFISILLLTGVILTIIAIIYSLVNLIFGFVSAFYGKYNPILITTIIKVLLIPWYIFNFIFGLCVIGVLANPFLMIGIPIMLFLLVGSTYLLMISTSIYNISFMINKLIKREIKVSPGKIILLVLLCFFISDVVSAIVMNCLYKDI